MPQSNPVAPLELISHLDILLCADGLEAQYSPNGGGSHPRFTRADWRADVENEDTISGYWACVSSELRMLATEAEDGQGVRPAPMVEDEHTQLLVSHLAQLHGWSPMEAEHALDNAGNSYGDETVVETRFGRSIHCPAHPSPCDYVRVVQSGFELMYWDQAEWAQAPSEVMGAFLGLVRGAAGSA